MIGVPISVYVEIENITSRFLLRTDPSVSCTDVANELSTEGFAIYEVRRFVRKAPSGSETPPSVLITCVGSLLQEVKLWYQVFRISIFVDKQQQCRTCHRFTHSTRACRSDKQLCSSCGEAHPHVCSATSPRINCSGAHTATNKDCPQYQLEIRLQKFKSPNHLTIRKARHQFMDNVSTSSRSSGKVTFIPPPEGITKIDLEAALQSVTSQFTTIVQSLVSERNSSDHSWPG